MLAFFILQFGVSGASGGLDTWEILRVEPCMVDCKCYNGGQNRLGFRGCCACELKVWREWAMLG